VYHGNARDEYITSINKTMTKGLKQMETKTFVFVVALKRAISRAVLKFFLNF